MEEEKEGHRMPIMNKSIEIDVKNLVQSVKQPRISNQLVPDSFRLKHTSSPKGPQRRQKSQKLEMLQNSLNDVAN